ncbi:MAG: TonB-dependent receptor [Bacteroidales bacterium]|nr:TonB-dependent receptor [Bacteroidales bacterium]
MKKILIATLLICLAQVVVAQTSIVGRIFDADENTPIPFAQVAIFSAQDTSLIDGTTTTDDGSFMIGRVQAGSYIFRAMFVGYTSIEKIIEITDESRPFDLGRINLSQGMELAGFEISETFIPVQMRGDTIDFNAEAFRPVEGSPLIDLLRRLPGVEVDDEGRITVGGREVTNILVDGERFFDDDPQVAAQNIPADFVQRVRTYNRRSRQAQFSGIDDGDEETVIDLSFRPGMSQGWFGRLTGGLGMDAVSGNRDFRFDNSFNINYFRGRNQLTFLGGFNNVNNLGFTDIMAGQGGQRVVVMGGGRGGGGRGGGFGGMFGGITQSFSPGLNFVMRLNENLTVGGSYAFARTDRRQEQQTFREDILPFGSQFYDEWRESNPISYQHRFNAEIRYTPNEDNELIIRPSFTFGNTVNNIFSDFSTSNDRDFIIIDSHINNGTTHNFSDATRFDSRLRVDYRRRLARPQRTISFEFDGGYSFNSRTDTNRSEIFFGGVGFGIPETINQSVTNEGWRYNWRAQVAYTEPLIHDFTLELRYSISSSEDWSERIARDFVTGQIDTLFSNEFSNTFFNQRFEARLQRTTDNYRLMFGVAVTPSWINSFSIENGNHIDIGREDPLVWNWSPQAQFQYNFSRQHTLRFNYSGRTNQPSVSQLQPVPDNSDPMSIRVGNPGLRPEFTHSIRLMYNNFFENFSSLSANVFFNLTQNRIVNTTITRDGQFDTDFISNNPQLANIDTLRPGARIIMPYNIGNVYNVFGMIAYSTPLFTQRITLSSTTGGGLTHTKSMVDQEVNELNNIMFNQNLRVTYRLPRFDVSLNGRIQINDARYSLQQHLNNTFYTTSGGADFTFQIIQNRLFLSSDMNFSVTSGSDDPRFNRNFTLWNAQLSWNLGQNNAGQLRLRVVDILDQNRNGNNRINATENRIEHIWVNTLPRYVIVSFTYNLNTSMRQNAPQQDGVRGPGQRHFQHPGGGRPGGQQVVIHQVHQ